MDVDENKNILKPLECDRENLIVLHKAIFEMLKFFVDDVEKKVSGIEKKENLDINK
jgi:hypothetical protein